MKKLLLICGLLAVFAACSDEEAKTEYIDPWLPVTDLQIPTKELIESEITLYGKGFEKDCKIRMQFNGGETYDTEIVTVAGDSLVFNTVGVPDGFYVLLLDQGGKTYRIGGINLVYDRLNMRDHDAYGVMYASSSRFCPVSLKRKIVGDPLFVINERDYYGGVLSGDILYYADYRLDWEEVYPNQWQWSRSFTVTAYDLKRGTEKILAKNIEGFQAIGMIRGKVNIFYYDTDGLFHLKEWTGNAFREVLSFQNTVSGKNILMYNGTFLFDEARNAVIMTGWDMTGDTRKFVWTFNLDNPEIRETGGASDVGFYLVECEGTVYAFGIQPRGNDEDVLYDTYVVRLDDPTDWQFATLTPEAVFKNIDFSAPVYDKKKKVIYGLSSGRNGGTVVTYDPQSKQLVGGKWVDTRLEQLIVF